MLYEQYLRTLTLDELHEELDKTRTLISLKTCVHQEIYIREAQQENPS